MGNWVIKVIKVIKADNLITLITLMTLITLVTSSHAQNLMAFIDYQKKLQVFDDGVFRQAEYMPVQSFRVGHSCVAYVDNTTEFRIFCEGQSNDIEYGQDIDYLPTRNLLVFRIGKVLR